MSKHPICRAVLLPFSLLAFVLMLGACSHVVPLQRTSMVPSAAGSIKISQDANKNSTIEMNVQRLAPPKNLTPPKATYLIWARGKADQLYPLGALKVDEEGTGKYKGVVPTGNFRVLITAEDSTTVKTPSDKVVLSTAFVSAD